MSRRSDRGIAVFVDRTGVFEKDVTGFDGDVGVECVGSSGMGVGIFVGINVGASVGVIGVASADASVRTSAIIGVGKHSGSRRGLSG